MMAKFMHLFDPVLDCLFAFVRIFFIYLNLLLLLCFARACFCFFVLHLHFGSMFACLCALHCFVSFYLSDFGSC